MRNIIELNKEKFSTNKVWNYIKVGKVIFLKCLTLKTDEVRHSNFIGICTSIRHKNGSISIVNNIKKERVETRFSIYSPVIDRIIILKRYKEKYRLRNINNII